MKFSDMWKILVLSCLAHCCFAYKILGFFPMPAVSHHRSFAYPILELARRGHQIVYITPIVPDFTHPNIEIRQIKNFRNEFTDAFRMLDIMKYPIPVRTIIIHKGMEDLAENFFGDPVVQELVHGSEVFDAVMVESYTNQEPASALLHKFGAPAIEIVALGDLSWVHELAGLPHNPGYMVDYSTESTDTMTLSERIVNYCNLWANTIISYVRLWRMQKVMNKYFNYTGYESRPHIGKLLSNRSIILQNRDVAMSYPYPLPPHVKDIGGINILAPKPLPKDIQKFMDESTKGVILFSLGSMLNTSELVSTKFGQSFINAFKALPQNVIMKSEIGKMNFLPSNVMTYKWLPQNDILAHNNCVLFITHGGYNSLSESVYHQVPVVGIPFFVDQPKNMVQVASAGMGINLLRNNVSEESLSWAIREVLYNPRYKKEVMKRSEMMKERAKKAAEKAVYWIEHAIKYPNALTPRSAYMNFFEVHMFDVKFIIFVALYISYKLILFSMRVLIRNFNQVKKKYKTL